MCWKLSAVVLNWINLGHILVTLFSVDFLFFHSGASENTGHLDNISGNEYFLINLNKPALGLMLQVSWGRTGALYSYGCPVACLHFPKYWIHLFLLRKLMLQGRWERGNMVHKWSSLSESLKLRDIIQFSSAKTRCKWQTFASLSLAPVQASCSWNKENMKRR